MTENNNKGSTRHGVGNRVSLLPILAVNFVGSLGFSIVLPFLVFLVVKWGGNALVYGAIGATYSIFQLVGAPILGRWSDRYGRRKILLLSQVGTLASWAIFLLAFALPTMPGWSVDSALLGRFTLTLPLVVVFLARAADGLTGGNVSVANAYLADITDEADRSRNFGRMAVAGNLGFIVGPALAGLLGVLGPGELLPVIAAFGISVVATLIIVFGLKEARPCTITAPLGKSQLGRSFGQEQKECYSVKTPPAAGWRAILSRRHMPLLLGIYFLVMLGFSFFYVAFPTHAASRLQWNVGQTGSFFAVLSLLMALVQGPLLSRLTRKVPNSSLVLVGGLALAIGFGAFLGEHDVPIYLGAALLALGNGLMWPSVLAVLSERAGPDLQGAAQGLASGLGAIASIVGLIAGGLLYGWLASGVFVVSAITIAATLPLSAMLLK